MNTALGDKTERVREVAAKLLTSLPTSALARRMRARAEAMLTLKNGALDAKPPTAVDAEWERDGLTEKGGQGAGQRTIWMAQVLSRVPPSYWETQFGMAPDKLIAATAGSKWRINILESWNDAAGRFKEQAWAAPLWRMLARPLAQGVEAGACRPFGTLWHRGADARARRSGAIRAGGACRPQEARRLLALRDPRYAAQDRGARRSPTPGSLVCLGFIGGITAQTKLAEPWDDTLETAALALPETHFINRVEPLDIPDSKHWQITYFRTQLDEWQTTVSLRRRIAKELPL